MSIPKGQRATLLLTLAVSWMIVYLSFTAEATAQQQAATPQEPPAAPPTDPAEAQKYANASQSAKAVLTSLRKLDIKIGMGINYKTYEEDLQNLIPDLQLFLESPEARQLPELAFVFSNARDCYVKVRSTWGESVYADDPTDKYRASVFLLCGRPLLWKAASVNVSGARVLLEGGPTCLTDFRRITGDANRLTEKFITEAAEAEIAKLRAEAGKDKIAETEAERQAKEKTAQREEAVRKQKIAAEKARWRVWTDASRVHTVEAQFRGMIGDRVKLARRDGTEISVPLDQLCEEDRTWVQARGK